MRRFVVVFMLAATAPVALAQEELTKRQVVDRSAAICRDLVDDAFPHLRRFQRADTINKTLRHGRRFIRTSRPYVRDLGDLDPPGEGRRYRRFVNNTAGALDWFDALLNAVEANRGRLVEERGEKLENHVVRARHAAERYPLRRSCIRFVSPP